MQQKSKSKPKPENRQPVYVAVISSTGKVLEPTNRCGHVRYLLRTGKAKVVRTKPFTIRLLYETPEITWGEVLGIDPGRTNIGLATVKEGGTCTGRFKAETRNKEVPKLMQMRKGYRMQHRRFRRTKRQRRAVRHATFCKQRVFKRVLPGCETPITCKEIKNKEARFNNRVNPDGWLTPTANHLLQTHLHLVDKIIRIRPIKKSAIEVNKFAFMELDSKDNGKDIKSIDYRKGPLYGYEDVEDAVSKQQGGKCLLCGERSIDHYHHIIPRHWNGSNTIRNIAGLCDACHGKVHKDKKAAKDLAAKKKGIKKQYAGTSILNQVIPHLIKALKEKYPKIQIRVTDGYKTKDFRKEHNLTKDHDIDAYCIACSSLDITDKGIKTCVRTEKIKQFRRQDRQCCNNAMADRKYYLGGKVVAINRHKRMEQKTDSLEEFRKTHARQEISKLVVKEHPATYKDRDRVMPGAVLEYIEKLPKRQIQDGMRPFKKKFVLACSTGKHNGKADYFVSTSGEKYRASRCNIVAKNTGLVFV